MPENSRNNRFRFVTDASVDVLLTVLILVILLGMSIDTAISL